MLNYFNFTIILHNKILIKNTNQVYINPRSSRSLSRSSRSIHSSFPTMTGNKSISIINRIAVYINTIFPIKSIIHPIHRTGRVSQSSIITSLILNNDKSNICIRRLINRTRIYSIIIMITCITSSKSTIFKC